MALELYINDNFIALKKNKGIGMTFQIGSVLNPNTRDGNNTNKFIAPFTQGNIKNLGHLTNINSSSKIPYQKNTARMVQNGVELVPDGFAIIEETLKGFKIAVYSGNVSFFDFIKGRNISELDWTDSCHNFDVATIIASFTNNSDYIYPMIDWGNGVDLLDNSLLQNTDALLPVARMSVVLRKIIEFAGFELKGSFVNYQQFDRLILTPNKFGYTEDEVNRNSGFAKEVTVVNDSAIVTSVCNSGAGQFEKDIPVDYTVIDWDNFLIDEFTPDNSYYGTFDFKVEGGSDFLIPSIGENLIENDAAGNNDIFSNGNINDDYICYVRKNGASLLNELVLLDLKTNNEVVVHSQTGTISFTVSMTETTGGYVAFSVTTSLLSEVKLYEISTAITTVIFTEAVPVSNVIDYIKIFNGRIAWFNDGGGSSTEGIWMYDIGTATTKNVTLSTNLTFELDHNGDDLVWHDFVTDDTSIFNYVLGTNSIIENTPGAGAIKSLKVFGDYVTYFTVNGFNFRSFKISTTTLVTAKNYGSDQISGSSRTLTKLSWIDTTGQLHVYDLLTDTLTTTIEVSGNSGENRISMNDDFVTYVANSFQDVRYYDINGVSVTTISVDTQSKTNVIIGKSNVIFYVVGGSTDKIKYYNVNASTFFTDVADVTTNTIFIKALNNDRLLFNNQNVSDDPKTRVSYINPLFNTLELNLKMNILEDGIPVYTKDVTMFNPSTPFIYLETLNTGLISVKTGSDYKVEFLVSAIKDETINYYIDYDLDVSSFSFTASRNIPYGAKIDFGTLLDNSMEKVLKDVLNIYSLTIQTNQLTKQIFLSPLDDLDRNKIKAPDWSSKVNLKTLPSTSYSIGGYAQINNLIYAADEDVPVDTGKGTFLIDDTKLPQEKDVIKLFSAAVESSLRIGNEHVPTIPFETSVSAAFDSKKSRILLLDPIDKTVNFKNTVNGDTGQATIQIPFCYFSKSGKVDSLDFTNLIVQNYSVLLGIMNKVKFIKAGITLSEIDVLNRDFTIPIYLDIHVPGFHANGYFYINKIPNYKENATTRVELIRL